MGEERGEAGGSGTGPLEAATGKIDAVAFLLEQVAHLDRVVHAQQAFVNALLPEIFVGRDPTDEVSNSLDAATANLKDVMDAYHQSKSRWRQVSSVVVQQQRAAEKGTGGNS